MNDVELERLAHRAADSLRREAHRLAAPAAALAELLDRDSRASTGHLHTVPLDGHPAMRRRAWLALASAAAVVVLVVGVAMISQGTDGELPTLNSTPGAATSTVAPTAPTGPITFEYAVSSYEGTDVITPVAINNTGVCFTVEFADTRARPCVDAETIAQGTMWGAFGHPDGGWMLHGVVPDAVDTVEVDGQPVDFVGNVWSTRISQDTIQLRVGDSTTNRWVVTTIELGETALPTTTVPVP